MGGITVSQPEPLFVDHGDSLAVVYWVEDTEEAREAARGLIDAVKLADPLDPSKPVFLLIDQSTAHVYALDRERLA